MRKVLASLFVIIAVVGAGVFATGAYFTDTITQSNLTFQTGNADLKFGFCLGGLGADCSGTDATLDSLASFPAATIGPGITNADCMVIENRGDYTLNLTGGVNTYTQSVAGMSLAFLVKAEMANSSCQAVGSVVFGMQPLHQAYLAGAQSFGSLAPGGKIYVIWSNAWDSTGNQNGFQDGVITINTYMTGQTV